jgi:hypothetical protein
VKFYLIHRADAPSVQCETNLRLSKPMRGVDGPSFIFIVFNVPALTPCLNCIEATLQLSDKLTPFSSRGIYINVIEKDTDRHLVLGVPSIYMLYSFENMTEP